MDQERQVREKNIIFLPSLMAADSFIVASLFGMNLYTGLEENQYAFLMVAGSTVLVMSIAFWILQRMYRSSKESVGRPLDKCSDLRSDGSRIASITGSAAE